jgi:hypothetical protein
MKFEIQRSCIRRRSRAQSFTKMHAELELGLAAKQMAEHGSMTSIIKQIRRLEEGKGGRVEVKNIK